MVDPRTLELVNNRLDEAVREMQTAIFRTGYSTIIRESEDTSAGITTREGEIVAQSFQHPLHLGVFKPTVDAVFEYFEAAEIHEGDVFLMNDPYIGGTPHANDMIVANPVFAEGELAAFAFNIAHKPDLGGLVQGTSSGAARELYHEGIQFPPVRIEKNGEEQSDVFNVIANNSRLPEITLGDLRGQIGCTRIGKRKLGALFEEFGLETVTASLAELLDATERGMRETVADWPRTAYEGEVKMDVPADNERWTDDLGDDEILHLRVGIETTDDGVVFDFTDTDDQVALPINLRPHIVSAVCQYALIGLAETAFPGNSGVARVCDVRTRPGSALDPERPAPVNQYVYPVINATRLVLRTLSRFLPETAVADEGGMSAITVGSDEMDSVQYEMLFSSYGGSTRGDGATGVSTHTMNIRTTPIEIIESEFPSRVDAFEVIPDSEGPGEHRGGFGIRRNYTIESDVQFTYRSFISNVFPPSGVAGGGSPERASSLLVTRDDETRRLPTIADPLDLEAGSRVSMEVMGAGGYGDPHDRDPEAVLRDYRDGFLSRERAESVYGVVIDPETAEIESVDRH